MSLDNQISSVAFYPSVKCNSHSSSFACSITWTTCFSNRQQRPFFRRNEKHAVVARYVYEPFGNVMSLSGPLAQVNQYRFSSKEAHPVSGLVYYGFRFYDPNLQRWVNRDPIAEWGGLPLHGFNRNSSIGSVDPDGLRSYGRCMAWCLADATLNFGTGFCPGGNALKGVLELAGVLPIDVQPFQRAFGYDEVLDADVVDGVSAVADGNRVFRRIDYEIKGGDCKLDRYKQLVERRGFEHQPPKREKKILSTLRSLNKARRLLSLAGGVATLLNALDYAYEIRQCFKKCEQYKLHQQQLTVLPLFS